MKKQGAGIGYTRVKKENEGTKRGKLSTSSFLFRSSKRAYISVSVVQRYILTTESYIRDKKYNFCNTIAP
jgi:hypothetical protein